MLLIKEFLLYTSHAVYFLVWTYILADRLSVDEVKPPVRIIEAKQEPETNRAGDSRIDLKYIIAVVLFSHLYIDGTSQRK